VRIRPSRTDEDTQARRALNAWLRVDVALFATGHGTTCALKH
jgi:hypothetical protein